MQMYSVLSFFPPYFVQIRMALKQEDLEMEFSKVEKLKVVSCF